MIREFENKLTKELLKIVHYNLQTSVRLSLFSKDVTVDFPFLRKTVPQKERFCTQPRFESESFRNRKWSAIYLSGCRCLSRADLFNMSSDLGGSFSIVHAHIKALFNLIKLSSHAKAGYNNCSLKIFPS